MIVPLIAFLVSFTVALMLMPTIIKILKNISATQTILGYVENHKDKNGTTTMGGVVFMLTTLIVSFCFIKFNLSWIICLLVSIFYGVLGLMDDYIKIKYKQNMGLRAYQKIIGQLGIAVIFAIYVYFSTSGVIFLPFINTNINLGFWIIPLVILVLLATTNSVNLTDGLDGLAGNVTAFYLVFFTLILFLVGKEIFALGETGKILQDINNINILSMIFVGSILAFLIYNTSKASIFMGDAGSLCLGGYIGASACTVGMELIVPILGICFVFSAISVILQVFVYKIKKKRIFKMAPFHHHLQLSGLSEPKIVSIYSALTVFFGVVCIILYLL